MAKITGIVLVNRGWIYEQKEETTIWKKWWWPTTSRLYLQKDEKPEDAKKRLFGKEGKYKAADDTKFDKGTNSFIREQKDASPRKPKGGDSTADFTDNLGKDWSLKKGEDEATVLKRAIASYEAEGKQVKNLKLTPKGADKWAAKLICLHY